MPRGIAAIVAITIALIVGGTVALLRSRTPSMRVVAILPEAPGIVEGGMVEYRGVRVGTVERLRLTDSAVVLTLRLERQDLPLRNTDRVAVLTRGIGGRALAIVPSRDAGQAWQPGDTLQPVPPDTLGAEREAAARALMNGAIQRALARDSLARASRAASAAP